MFDSSVPPHSLSCPKSTFYLIVQVEVVELPIGTEVLRVLVQGEIDIPAVTLDHHRVPVMVVQETATRH